jgi:cyclase
VTGHMRVLRPHPAIFAFYDGRVPGYRFAEEPNWVDEGALALGIASYAIVSGTHALVYDTHVSLPHAAEIRETLAQEGVTTFTVVLSHWHLDHVAGTGAFADCEIISTERTAAHLERHRAAIEAGTHEGPPAISPLVLPTRVFSGTLALDIGAIRLELIEADIHSDDAAVVWWESERILLAGDTMEDTVTYVTEPDGLERHLVDLARLDALARRPAFSRTTAIPTSSRAADTAGASIGRCSSMSARCCAPGRTPRSGPARSSLSSRGRSIRDGSPTTRPMKRCTKKTSKRSAARREACVRPCVRPARARTLARHNGNSRQALLALNHNRVSQARSRLRSGCTLPVMPFR